MSRRQQVQPGGTNELQKAARASRAADERLATAMFTAHEAGSSLRTIATVTGMSHEKVRVMIAQELKRIATVEQRIARTTGWNDLSTSGRERAAGTARRLQRTLPVKKSDG